MRPSLRLGLQMLALVAIASGFAIASALARYAYDDGANALTVSFARMVAASLALIVVALYSGVSLVPRSRAAIVPAAVLGLVLAAYSLAIFVAIGLMPVALVILCFYTWPLLVGIAAWWLGWERLTWLWPLAACGAVVGLVLALDAGGQALSAAGVILSLGAACGWTIVMLFNRKLVGGGDSRPVTFVMTLTAAALYALAMAVTGGFSWPHVAIAQAAVIASAAIYSVVIIAIFWASKTVGPVRTALVMYSEPVVSLLVNTVINHQVLTMIQVAGAALVVASLMLSRLATR